MCRFHLLTSIAVATGHSASVAAPVRRRSRRPGPRARVAAGVCLAQLGPGGGGSPLFR